MTYKNSGKPAGCLKPRGYNQITYNKKLYYRHRVVFYSVHGYLPQVVDHVRGVEAGDGIGNLQAITQSQNCAKRRMRSDNTSGNVGVYPKNGRFIVRIKHHNKNLHVGTFDTVDEAVAARKIKMIELFGMC